ncbi:MAG: hypothetical protein HS113_13250 [Verrucomicrobiales bacterium]|nr:hypothetical protein [Verrucomicrobiales bacterium]
MARGDSGRIVIEVEPEMKRRLYSALALSGSTLKDWFLEKAAEFCADAGQLPLFPRSELPPRSQAARVRRFPNWHPSSVGGL